MISSGSINYLLETIHTNSARRSSSDHSRGLVMPRMARKASDELKNRFLPELDYWVKKGRFRMQSFRYFLMNLEKYWLVLGFVD